MGTIKIRKDTEWINPCEAVVKFRKDSSWKQLVGGTKVYINGVWQNVVCSDESCAIPTGVSAIKGSPTEVPLVDNFINNSHGGRADGYLWDINTIIQFSDGKVYLIQYDGDLDKNDFPSADLIVFVTTLPIDRRPSSLVTVNLPTYIQGGYTVSPVLTIATNGDVNINLVDSKYGTIPSDVSIGSIDYDSKIFLYNKDIGTTEKIPIEVSFTEDGLFSIFVSGDTALNFSSIETVDSPVTLYINNDTGIKASINRICSTPPDYSDLSESVTINL